MGKVISIQQNDGKRDRIKEIHQVLKELSIERRQLAGLLEDKEREIAKLISEKDKIERSLVGVKVIPPGRSGIKTVAVKKISLEALSVAEMQALILQLSKRMEGK